MSLCFLLLLLLLLLFFGAFFIELIELSETDAFLMMVEHVKQAIRIVNVVRYIIRTYFSMIDLGKMGSINEHASPSKRDNELSSSTHSELSRKKGKYTHFFFVAMSHKNVDI